jgi:hypothetical protein
VHQVEQRPQAARREQERRCRRQRQVASGIRAARGKELAPDAIKALDDQMKFTAVALAAHDGNPSPGERMMCRGDTHAFDVPGRNLLSLLVGVTPATSAAR